MLEEKKKVGGVSRLMARKANVYTKVKHGKERKLLRIVYTVHGLMRGKFPARDTVHAPCMYFWPALLVS
jgi:hypothetical protein